MAKPLSGAGWLTLAEAAKKYGQARTSFYLWERKGLLQLRRFPVGRPSVFVNEQELATLLGGLPPRQPAAAAGDQAALNNEALAKIWDNEIDAVYEQIDWRTGKRGRI